MAEAALQLALGELKAIGRDFENGMQQTATTIAHFHYQPSM
jgi:hypothetical protein